MIKSWYERQIIDDLESNLQPALSLNAQKRLEELLLFYEVPMPYLLPHPELLPQESIRCFHVDEAFVQALLEGFCSLGRIRPSDLDIKIPVAAGVFLRSCMVRFYKGLEVKGFDNSKRELPLLRMSRLEDDIMMCLFQEMPASLVISEPKESITYGYQEDEETKETWICLKNIKTGAVTENRQTVRTNGRKLDLSDLKEKLTESMGIEKIHAGHMAVELIRNQEEGEWVFD